jgi:hypothetical protein
MSSSRHPETDGLTERVNITFQQLLRCFCCYDGTSWTYLLPQVEFADNVLLVRSELSTLSSRPTIGSLQTSPMTYCSACDVPFRIRKARRERIRLLQEVHALVRSVLQLHHDEMQGRSRSLTAPQFTRGDKVTIVTKNLFLRWQPKRKLRDRQLGNLK